MQPYASVAFKCHSNAYIYIKECFDCLLDVMYSSMRWLTTSWKLIFWVLFKASVLSDMILSYNCANKFTLVNIENKAWFDSCYHIIRIQMSDMMKLMLYVVVLAQELPTSHQHDTAYVCVCMYNLYQKPTLVARQILYF